MRVALLVLGLIFVVSFPFVGEWISGKNIVPESVEKAIDEYIEKYPDRIIESLKNYHEKEIEASMREHYSNILSENKDKIYNTSYPNVGSNDDVVIVEFFNYECGYCKKSYNVTAKFIEDIDHSKFRYIFRPLANASIPSAMNASTSALAVSIIDNDKFIDFHSFLMSNGNYDDESIFKMVEELGIDLTRFKEVRESQDVLKMMDETIALMTEIGLGGTPSFIIDNNVLVGMQNYEALINAAGLK